MRNLALGALVAVAGLAVACDGSGRTYPSGRSDSDYNLRAMALTLEDLPRGFTQTEITQPPQSPAQFNNERWSLVINADEAEALRSQLEAQGRLSNYVAAFSPGGLGPVLAITSISTLYTDVESAQASVERVRQVDSQGQPTFVDTTVCFRTGRVIHAIQQTSVAGTEDIALGVRLAERMLIRVDAAFDEIDG